MKINIEEIKDAVYEFEGLLELADLREDKVEALYPLMKRKLEIVNALFADVHFTEDSVENVATEEDMEESEFLEDTEDVEENSVLEENSEKETKMIQLEESTEPIVIAIPEDDENESVTPVSAIAASSEERSALFVTPGPKPAFCINDRFRFRRELFNNSDADFNAAMDMVTTMDDYEEAEDYFLGALGWSMDKPEVVDFMAIIQNYFDK